MEWKNFKAGMIIVILWLSIFFFSLSMFDISSHMRMITEQTYKQEWLYLRQKDINMLDQRLSLLSEVEEQRIRHEHKR